MNLNSINAGGGKQIRVLLLPTSLICCTLILGLTPVRQAWATPGAGVIPEFVTAGNLPAPVRAKLKASGFGGFEDGTAVTQIAVYKFTIEPGGYFGWHRHGGPVWVVVDAGMLTIYDSDDPTCTGTSYASGSAFLDVGDHVHNAWNEGDDDVVVYGTFMLPTGGLIRIDATDPGVCPF
jgi:hypothetical protein